MREEMSIADYVLLVSVWKAKKAVFIVASNCDNL